MDLRLHPIEFTQRRLPFVCAVTGEPAAWYVTIAVNRTPNPALFLLILLPPIGWLVLLAALLRTDGTYVEVPISQDVYDDMQERRRRFRWMLAALVAMVIGFAYLGGAGLFPAAWLVFVPSILLAIWVGSVRSHRIRLSLDTVGLVTMHHIHPAFAAAVEEWRTAAPTPRP